MIPQEPLRDIIKPQYLYMAALFFAVLAFMLICLTFLVLNIKKRNTKIASTVDEQINEWIGEVLMEAEPSEFLLTPQLSLYMRKKANREALIDTLIRVRKNLTGSAAESIVELYRQLGLKDDSLGRFNSLIWHEKAKGIYELYMMDQEGMLPDIYTHTNSANEYVRMEAQIAIVGFWGFKGLVFLDTLEYPLHEWQQLKLLEQLSTLDTVHMDNLPLWLKSGNDYVVEFALKLADIYRQMDVHDIVLLHLDSNREKTRFQTIRTLGRLATESTADILILHYPKETLNNKKETLKQLATIGETRHAEFLVRAFSEEDDFLKLEAARSLALLNGSTEVLNTYGSDPAFESIVKQINFELNK